MTTQLTTETFAKAIQDGVSLIEFWGAMVPTLSDDGTGSGRTFKGL